MDKGVYHNFRFVLLLFMLLLSFPTLIQFIFKWVVYFSHDCHYVISVFHFVVVVVVEFSSFFEGGGAYHVFHLIYVIVVVEFSFFLDGWVVCFSYFFHYVNRAYCSCCYHLPPFLDRSGTLIYFSFCYCIVFVIKCSGFFVFFFFCFFWGGGRGGGGGFTF